MPISLHPASDGTGANIAEQKQHCFRPSPGQKQKDMVSFGNHDNVLSAKQVRMLITEFLHGKTPRVRKHERNARKNDEHLEEKYVHVPDIGHGIWHAAFACIGR